jgi:hypothetical protein
LAEGFSHFVAAQPVVEVVAKKVQARMGASDPYDTHPSLSERIAALEKMPSGDAPNPDPFAISMLTNLPDLEKSLLVNLTSYRTIKILKPAAKLKPISWEDVGVQTYFPLWEKQAHIEAAALAGVTPAVFPDLASNLPMIARTMADEREHQTSPPEASKLQSFATSILGAALTVTLHNNGWELSALPGDPVYARHDQWEIKPFDVLEELASGKQSADAWRQLCEEAGIADLDLGEV